MSVIALTFNRMRQAIKNLAYLCAFLSFLRIK